MQTQYVSHSDATCESDSIPGRGAAENMQPKPLPVLVIADHRRGYEIAITARQGDHVELLKVDPEAPGWTWCKHAVTDCAGWVPDVLLEPDDRGGATLNRDYSAIELTVRVGEELLAMETLAGWTWCERAVGDAGWVPDSKIKPLG
jgi:hypothetical protein